ncbi:metal-sulfur cluster assembly factor [Roseateles sp. DAIF2]|uniref:metal-sulfur cluster assembly factor n=1 Tax=Roseateles sp. DAIF2 TaxID=2714952 RepID=UPI0018A27498|nr:metal-sulfur cluster assembly factor [Roseateles sp. DAIF2]QPF74010.1 metal-sulfur cluster assembly factor [Roseateles sp. DAIF2]
MSTHPEPPFPYDGPEALREPVLAALRRVVDPEVAMSIVDVGLVYGVTIADQQARIRLTMTSPACPVADVILDEVEAELDRVLPQGIALDTQLVWEPPWSPERMSERARRFMGW